jgi:hypothetical protein
MLSYQACLGQRPSGETRGVAQGTQCRLLWQCLMLLLRAKKRDTVTPCRVVFDSEV